MKKSVVVSLLSLSTLIVGCENHKVDAEKKIEAIDSSINAKVVSIPEFAEPQVVDYFASKSRNPFIPSSVYSELQSYSYKRIYVNPNRKKQPLEAYDLETLTMVGVVGKGNGLSALIETADKDLVIVRNGSYLGLNQGRVTKVSRDGVELVEIIPDGRGGFRQRARTMLPINNDAPAS